MEARFIGHAFYWALAASFFPPPVNVSLTPLWQDATLGRKMMGDLGQFILFCSVVFVIAVFYQWAFICEIAKQMKDQKGFLEITVVLLAVIASVLIFSFSEKLLSNETIRNVILTLGGVGGFYALIISKRRQDRFEEQIKLTQKQTNYAQRQVFNDQLGRGVEMLANENQASIRMAGIRILQEMSKIDNQERKELIRNILVDFVHDEKIGITRKEINTAIFTILCVNTDQPITIENLDLSNLHFQNLTLKNVSFRNCHLTNTSFNETSFSICHFTLCDLSFAYFNKCTFDAYCYVNFSDLSDARFIHNTGLEPVFFNSYCHEESDPPHFDDEGLNQVPELAIVNKYVIEKNEDKKYIRMRKINDPDNPNNYILKKLQWPLPEPPY